MATDLLPRLHGLHAVALVCERLLPLVRFYEALGFSLYSLAAIHPDELRLLGINGRGLRARLCAGDDELWLDSFIPPGEEIPRPISSTAIAFQHFAIVTREVDALWMAAEAAGAQAITRDGPVTLPPRAGGLTAIKFRDPEGHPVELISPPPGSPRHYDGSGGPLGIDHSAMVVTDPEHSIDFYGRRGLACAGRTVNRGTAQGALDDVAHPVVTVVELRPADPSPHLELLGYQTTEAMPVPARPDAIAATRLVWRGDRADCFRDPDGHWHQLRPR